MAIKLTFQINEIIRKNRLDNFLFQEIKAVSKMYLRQLLKNDECTINGKPEKGGYHLQSGDFVEIEVDLNADTAMKPEDIPLAIVFEDAEIIVVDKPSGMLVHPTLGQKSGTLLNALSFYLKAIAGARQSKADVLTTNLKVAIQKDASFKQMAKDDAEFISEPL